jgi:putative endonuclease
MWQAYLVLCSDGTLYCGISRDIDVRLEEHNRGKGAKYTRARRPVRLVWYSDVVDTRSEATKLELQIKKLTRSQKWALIKEGVF